MNLESRLPLDESSPDLAAIISQQLRLSQPTTRSSSNIVLRIPDNHIESVPDHGLHNRLRQYLPLLLQILPSNNKTQIGGIALTSSIFYISLNLHERNRLYQSHLLRQQSNLLRNITDPQPKDPPQTARHLVPGLADRLKYRWNTELEAAVRKIQHFNWEEWRREAEDKVSSVFSKGLGSAVDEVEKKTT